ncbi:MAG: hypothetical protein M1813_003801 [Trichoglossum hirsutum]|nr:MAG: hypothetical protein M1813_003801 [Trichoglossum hirsutum]
MAAAPEDRWGGDFDPFADPEERRVLFAAVDSFCQYRKAAHYNVTHRRRQNFYALPSPHWQRLAQPPFSYLETLNLVDDAIDENADIAREIFLQSLSAVGLAEHPLEPTPDGRRHRLDWRGAATPQDVDKARTTIRQLYRDWSAEGAAERRACYDPIVSTLTSEFSHRPDKCDVKVLIPGAGLGRLVFEVCRAGFDAEGNEISYHQLLASSFILNHTSRAHQFPLYPFALNFSNHVSRSDQLRRVMVPDVHPGTALRESSIGRSTHAFQRIGMATGDFMVVYSDAAHAAVYDAVATVFFIDTAPNLLRYIETVHHCLKPGGIWINLGPLLWHFGDSGPVTDSNDGNAPRPTDEHEHEHNSPTTTPYHHHHQNQNPGIASAGSVELTHSEILPLIASSGFSFPSSSLPPPIDTGYIQDPASLLQNTYRAVHWVARKDGGKPGPEEKQQPQQK